MSDCNLEKIGRFDFSVSTKIKEFENKLYFFKENKCGIVIEKDFGYYDLNENKIVILDKKVNFHDFYITKNKIIYAYSDYLKIGNEIMKLPPSRLCQFYTKYNNIKEKICKYTICKLKSWF